MDFGDIICTVFAIIASCFVAFFALDLISMVICILYRLFCRLLGCFIKNFWGDKQPKMWDGVFDPLFPIMFAIAIYILGAYFLKWDFLSTKSISEIFSF